MEEFLNANFPSPFGVSEFQFSLPYSIFVFSSFNQLLIVQNILRVIIILNSHQTFWNYIFNVQTKVLLHTQEDTEHVEALILFTLLLPKETHKKDLQYSITNCFQFQVLSLLKDSFLYRGDTETLKAGEFFPLRKLPH